VVGALAKLPLAWRVQMLPKLHSVVLCYCRQWCCVAAAKGASWRY
jgi:hypothetical protein